MGSRVECFWMTPTDRALVDLRRYERVDYSLPREQRETCPANPMRVHDGTVVIGEIPWDPVKGRCEHGDLLGYCRDEGVPHDDPRWPSMCPTCGYAFKPEDHWQVNVHRLFSGAPDGKLYHSRNMPPGAMYDATWWGEKGPDGICLAVVLPPRGGDSVWHPDSPSGNSKQPWTRTGTLPKVTCRPSILTSDYHGFLTDGVLVEC